MAKRQTVPGAPAPGTKTFTAEEIADRKRALAAAQAEMDEVTAASASAADPPNDPDDGPDDGPGEGTQPPTPSPTPAQAPAPRPPARSATASLVPASDSAARVDEMLEISALCTIAGYPELAAGFVTDGTSLSAVRKALLDKRAAASAATAINGSFGAVSTAAMDKIDQLATALMASTPGLKKSAAYERALRANPSLYEEYNDERMAVAKTGSKRAISDYIARVKPHLSAMGMSVESNGSMK